MITWSRTSQSTFQSTLPAWGATKTALCLCLNISISIHAPRMGSDELHPVSVVSLLISIHAPRMGSDSKPSSPSSSSLLFQSTLPAWGATLSSFKTSPAGANFNPRSPHGERRSRPSGRAGHSQHFNPRSPHGERPASAPSPVQSSQISIHAPRMGSDSTFGAVSGGSYEFQSTLPAWGATLRCLGSLA